MARTAILTGIVLGALVLVSGAPVQAETIDDFEAGSVNLTSTSSSGTLSSNIAASGAIGGRRRSQVAWTSGPGTTNVSVFPSPFGIMSFSNQSLTQGWTQMTYGLNSSGVQQDNNWDFSGDNAFLLDLVAVDLSQSGGNLLVTAYNGATSYTSSSIAWPTQVGSWYVPFSTFATQPTWSAIDQLDFRFTTTQNAADVTIDLIKTIPEPSTILLLLGGGAILGMAGFRRRRKK